MADDRHGVDALRSIDQLTCVIHHDRRCPPYDALAGARTRPNHPALIKNQRLTSENAHAARENRQAPTGALSHPLARVPRTRSAAPPDHLAPQRRSHAPTAQHRRLAPGTGHGARARAPRHRLSLWRACICILYIYIYIYIYIYVVYVYVYIVCKCVLANFA